MAATRFRSATCAAILLLAALHADAQESGRWSWDAAVGLGQFYRSTRTGGVASIPYRQSDARAGAGLNGAIFHPSVALFRVELELLLSRVAADRERDTVGLFYGADLRLFSASRYPLRLYARRQDFDYSGPAAQDPLTLRGSPLATTTYGGHVRARSGPLRGFQLGVDRATIDFVDPAARRETHDRYYVDLARSGRSFTHHYRLEQRSKTYGTVDLATSDLVATVDEHGNLSPRWRWDLFVVGAHRESESSVATLSRTADYRMRNRFSGAVGDSDRLDITYNAGRYDVSGTPAVDSHELGLQYRIDLSRQWQIVPFARYLLQSSDDLAGRSPSAGAVVTWNRTAREVRLTLSARGSAGRARLETSEYSRNDRTESYGFYGSVAHEPPSGMRKALEVEFARNDLDTGDTPDTELPDVTVPLPGLTREDYERARLTLGQRWDSKSLEAYGEWRRRRSTDPLLRDFDLQSMTLNAQFGSFYFRALATLGRTIADTSESGDQTVDFFGASAYVTPWRPVNLYLVYRADRRDLAVLPDIDSDRWEAGATFRLGELLLNVLWFQSTEHVVDAPDVVNRGLRWGLSMRFAGWLPVVTGTRMRGEIR